MNFTIFIKFTICQIFKDILPQNKKNKSFYYVYQLKTQHLGIIWKIEVVFQFFYHSIFDASFCYLVEYPCAFSEQVKNTAYSCNF